MKFRGWILWIAAFAAALICGCAAPGADDGNEQTECPVKAVHAIGFMDMDGAKLGGIAVEYEEDLTGANVTKDTFQIRINNPGTFTYKGDGSVGDILKIYVNDEADFSPTGGSGSGRFVVMELFTDYICTGEQLYTSSMAVRVTQKEDIHCSDGKVIPADGTTVNNIVATKPVNLVMEDLEGFRWYTNNGGSYGADGPAFHQAHCFNQQDGLYYDEDLAYALYLPEDYSESGNYAMVTLQNPAATAGTHPLEAVLTSRSPILYSSDWAQELVKEEHGVDGLIVLVPVITERVDDNGGTPAEYEAVVHLWDYIIDRYHVNTNYIYGSGQSVGGMILLETNRLRDNFFAGLLLYEDQWAQNYYPETIFERDMVANETIAAGATMHYSRTDGYLTWDYSLDTEGNKVYEGHDPYNLYYLMSDDNIMIMNRTGNALSNDAWTELKYLYSDIAGYELEQLVIDANSDLSQQNSALKQFTARENPLNIQWVSLENGSNGYSCRKIDASYEWLLSQSRQSEISREKLDLNRPFELAEEQSEEEGRTLHFTDTDGNYLRLLKGKRGSGTRFYNSCWLNTKTVADAEPGWLPGNLSWESGVAEARIQGVVALGENAVVIEYDADMSGIIAYLAGDDIIGLDGKVRQDIKYTIDAYEFYDSDDNLVGGDICNLYVNTVAETRENAERGSGSGRYVIVEFSQSVATRVTGVKQRTTVLADGVVASASHIVRRYGE